jgi:hypothetical protein
LNEKKIENGTEGMKGVGTEKIGMKPAVWEELEGRAGVMKWCNRLAVKRGRSAREVGRNWVQ